MSEEKILSRVRKMMALAENEAASEGERDNALRMAYKLLAKLNAFCFVKFARRDCSWSRFCKALEERQCHALMLATQSPTSLFIKDGGA